MIFGNRLMFLLCKHLTIINICELFTVHILLTLRWRLGGGGDHKSVLNPGAEMSRLNNDPNIKGFFLEKTKPPKL